MNSVIIIVAVCLLMGIIAGLLKFKNRSAKNCACCDEEGTFPLGICEKCRLLSEFILTKAKDVDDILMTSRDNLEDVLKDCDNLEVIAGEMVGKLEESKINYHNSFLQAAMNEADLNVGDPAVVIGDTFRRRQEIVERECQQVLLTTRSKLSSLELKEEKNKLVLEQLTLLDSWLSFTKGRRELEEIVIEMRDFIATFEAK